jgi:hypothetical protein
MGYTHYWTIKEEITPAKFSEWAELREGNC